MNTNLENKKLTPEDVKGGFGVRHCQPEPEPATDMDVQLADDTPKPEKPKGGKP